MPRKKYFSISTELQVLINEAAEEVGLEPTEAREIYESFFLFVTNMIRKSQYRVVNLPLLGRLVPAIHGLKSHEAYLRKTYRNKKTEKALEDLRSFQKYRNEAFIEMINSKNKEKNEERLKRSIQKFYRFPSSLTDKQLQIDGRRVVSEDFLLQTDKESKAGFTRWRNK